VLKDVDALLKQFYVNFESCARKKIENKFRFSHGVAPQLKKGGGPKKIFPKVLSSVIYFTEEKNL
jgi:hypothetical protein